MRLRFLAAVGVLTMSFVAHADTFSFSFGSPSDSFAGSGTLTASLLLGYSNRYQITSVSGTNRSLETQGDDLQINSLVLLSEASEANDFDDTGDRYEFTQIGLGYQLTNGLLVNLYEAHDDTDREKASFYIIDPFPELAIEPITITRVAATPEPGSFFLLSTGFLGIAGAVRKHVVVGLRSSRDGDEQEPK